MGKIVTVLILLTLCLPIYIDEQFSNYNYDTFLEEQIKGRNSILYDQMNPRDSMYLISWIKPYDLNGKPIERFTTNFQIVVFPKQGKPFSIISISEAEQFGIDSIYHRELYRISKLINSIDIPKLIKDKEPCINNEFEYAGVLNLIFVYGLKPKLNSEIVNDSINGK